MDKHQKIKRGKTRRKKSWFPWVNNSACSVARRSNFWDFCTGGFVGFLPSLPNRKKTNKQKRNFGRASLSHKDESRFKIISFV